MSEQEKKIIVQAKAEKEKLQAEESRVKDDVLRKAKPTCGICGRYLFDPPRCGGHGSSGGGGGSEDGVAKDDAKSLAMSGHSTGSVSTQSSDSTMSYKENNILSDLGGNAPSLDENTLNLMVIAKLLATNVFSIKNDSDNGDLSIKIDHNKWCELSFEGRKELQKFIKTILQVFNDFKEQLDPSNKNKCACTIETDTLDNNNILSLNVKIANPGLYDKFIQQLTGAIKRLGVEKDDPAVNLIITLFQDQSKVSNDKKEEAKSKFLNFYENESQKSKDLSKENSLSNKITPLPTKPTPKS